MVKDKFMDDLFSKDEKEYGTNYKNHLFEQYKLYIDSAEKTSDRRQQANNYFIAVNTALISLIGISFQDDISKKSFWLKILLPFLGIIICVIFYFIIKSYRQLNTGKFKIIHKIERHLPLALYKHEWKVLGEGEDINNYYPFSHIESFIPWTFGLLYFLLMCSFLSIL